MDLKKRTQKQPRPENPFGLKGFVTVVRYDLVHIKNIIFFRLFYYIVTEWGALRREKPLENR